MSDFILQHARVLHFFWLVPILGLIIAWGFMRRKALLEKFASSNLLNALLPNISNGRMYLRGALVLLAFASLVFASAGPRWGKQYRVLPREGFDLFICLDVSKSMLAKDVKPSRLERAKDEIKDLLARIPGDRVGLITFAGDAHISCPLTINYGWLKQALDDVTVRSITRGGSNVGDAVRMAADSFGDKAKEYKAILLITDGEDHESYPVDAARDAYEEHGIRVFTVGIGDPEGRRIPIKGQDTPYLQYQGKDVWSKLDEKTLQEMAVEGGGSYFPARMADIDLMEIYEMIEDKVEKREFEESEQAIYIHRFPWFAGFALALLMLETLVSDKKK